MDASIDAYQKQMKVLTGKAARINKGLVLKLAGSIHASSIYMPKFMRGSPFDPEDPKGSQIAQETVALSIVLNQLEKLDPKYKPYAEAIRNDAALSKERYPGIEKSLK